MEKPTSYPDFKNEFLNERNLCPHHGFRNKHGKPKLLKYLALVLAIGTIAACDRNDSSDVNDKQTAAGEGNQTADPRELLKFADAQGSVPPLPQSLEMLPVQLALDRMGFSPGVLDGKNGESLKLAIKGFQKANGLEETAALDEATLSALEKANVGSPTRLVRIPAMFADQTFYPDFPDDAADQANLPALGYRSLMEALAERFHTTPETLLALNSLDTQIGAGKIIVVPNLPDAPLPSAELSARGWDKTLLSLGVAGEQPDIETVVVDKSEGWLRTIDGEGKIIGQFPVTTGSSRDPLPIGNWTVKGVARNPEFHYNPKLFWDVSDSKEKQLLKPGPNSPVGVVWIDLSKPHYGIHGTGEPSTIGRAESHGCVRLTNWDAARVAGMAKPGTKVVFQK
jgi:lipoprotein-anchoring transpeptidase ErfK/SrfK